MAKREPSLSCRRAEVLLDAYLDGDLPARRKAPLEAHLATCFTCAQELERARSLRDALRALPERFCGDAVTDAVLARIRGERREAPATGAGLGGRLREWLARRVVPAWQPVAALAAVALVVLGVTHYMTRPPVEQSVSPQDVARAEVQVRWVMAHLGDISRRTGDKVRDEVLHDRVGVPAARAVQNALETNVRQ